MAAISAVAVSAVLKAATGQTLQGLLASGPIKGLIAHAGLLLALVGIPTALSLALWKEPFSWSGWSPTRGGRLAGLGLICGAGLMALIAAILWAAGALSLEVRPVSAGQVVGMILTSAALWLIQAAHEEGLHRGYAFVQLSRALSFWPAALILSVAFMAGHIGNVGATPVSLAVAGLFALVLAWSFLRSGSLWFALGFHAAWNFTQSFVFGFPNSGQSPPDALMTAHVRGASLLTGGGAGPEGSLLGVGAVIALAVIIQLGLPRRVD